MYAAAVSAGLSGISQILNAMFSATSGESSFATTSTTQTLSTSCDSTANLMGSGKAQLSSQILSLLAALQTDPSQDANASNAGGNSSQNPLFADAAQSGSTAAAQGHHGHHHGMAKNLMDMIDGDDDSDSAGENPLESLIVQNGSTSSQADRDSAAPASNGSGAISPSELLNAIRQYQSSLGSNGMNFLDVLAQSEASASS